MTMKPIRVLHVIGIMDRGGAETMIMNLYRNIDRSKVQFDFVEHSDKAGAFDQEITDLGGKIYHCPKLTRHISNYYKWWSSFFEKHKNEYSFVHGHIGSTAAIYLHAAKKYGIKTIAHSHNVYGKPSLKTIEYRIISYPTRFIADYLFACSKSAGTDRFGGKRKITVVHNSIDSEKYAFDSNKREIIRKQLSIPDHALVIGNVSRFYKQKNHVFLLNVFKRVLEINPDEILLLVGDGPLRSELINYASEAGIKESIRFLGVREDVPDLLSAMDIMVFPSLYEGFGIAALEAQANGLRVLCSEGVSEECHITDLFFSMNLDDGFDEWAERISSLCNYERVSPLEQIRNAGFDIKESASWLQDFYLKGIAENV